MQKQIAYLMKFHKLNKSSNRSINILNILMINYSLICKYKKKNMNRNQLYQAILIIQCNKKQK